MENKKPTERADVMARRFVDSVLRQSKCKINSVIDTLNREKKFFKLQSELDDIGSIIDALRYAIINLEEIEDRMNFLINNSRASDLHWSYNLK